MAEQVKRGPGRPRKAVVREADNVPMSPGVPVGIILVRNYFVEDSVKVRKGERIDVPDYLAWSLVERGIGRRA